MPGKRKPFVDKNKSVTFRLVHRSQKDPFIVNADGGDRVLAPISSQRGTHNFPADDRRSVASQPSWKRKEEQAKYGVYFDDDYDYLQHLRDVNEVVHLEPVEERFRVLAPAQVGLPEDKAEEKEKEKKPELRLPASLFECKDVELKVGLLNQAAPAPGPHPDLDPDIVALLDDEEGEMDFEELEDDFVAKANASVPGEEDQNDDDGRSDEMGEEQMGSDFGEDEDDEGWPKEETRSRFTEYSMSSAVIPRTEGLQQLDARFEKIYEQYDDSEVGSLDGESETSDEESDGNDGLIDLNSKRMLEMAEEFEKSQQQRRIHLDDLGKFIDDRPHVYGDDDDQEPLDRVYVSEKQDRFDCETIVSTYSNLYNHPTLIKEETVKKVRLDPKTGLPVGALRGDGGLTKRTLNQLPNDEKLGVGSIRSVASSSIRPHDETPEQRRLRKQAVKAERRERRCEKKANKAAFKDEEIRRKAVDMNLKQNMQGLKLS